MLIVTDDQRWDTLEAMPTVREELVGKGIIFRNAFVVNPECCPSRASILTGRYSHGTGVYTNRRDSGIEAFAEGSTLATWLDSAGYRTGMVGKYLNHYAGIRVPPGWDRWVAFSGSAGNHYYGYTLNHDGTLSRYGSTTADYSTDVLANHAVRFIDTAPLSRPLFLYFAPFAPHSPALPALRHQDVRFEDPAVAPSYNEADVSDKPQWLQAIPPMSAYLQDEIRTYRTQVPQALLAVDDAVREILSALRSAGRLSRAVIIYLSDNGIALGEHRWGWKAVPYEEVIRIPMVMRHDTLIPDGRAEERMVTNIDVAPTLTHLARVETPPMDGRPILPLLEPGNGPIRRQFLIEHLNYERPRGLPNAPTYCAIRARSRLFVRYATGEEEFYLLEQDPYQLVNRAQAPTWQMAIDRLRRSAARLCRPLPLGMPPF